MSGFHWTTSAIWWSTGSSPQLCLSLDVLVHSPPLGGALHGRPVHPVWHLQLSKELSHMYNMQRMMCTCTAWVHGHSCLTMCTYITHVHYAYTPRTLQSDGHIMINDRIGVYVRFVRLPLRIWFPLSWLLSSFLLASSLFVPLLRVFHIVCCRIRNTWLHSYLMTCWGIRCTCCRMRSDDEESVRCYRSDNK